MQNTQNLLKGSLLALLAFFAMAVFGILTNQAYQSGGAIWVSFLTYATATVGITGFILPYGFSFLKPQKTSYLIGRAVFGTAASFLYMLSLHYIPIVNATLLFNTAPIFIPLLMVLWLKKTISRKVWGAVFLGFIGIAVIIKPGLSLFTDPGNLLGLLSGASLAVAYLLIKLLTATDPGYRIIFYYFALGTLLQVPLLFFAGSFPDSHSLMYACLSGAALLAAQFALVKAYTYAEAYQVGIYQYCTVVFVGLIEWLVWGHTPGLADLLGMILVALAGIWIIRLNGKAN